MLLSAQRRLKNGLSVLSNYTLSSCMSDPATTEITGPTIVDPNNPDLDYSVLLVRSPSRRQRVGGRPHAEVRERRGQGAVQRLAVRRRSCGGRAATARRHDRRRQRARPAWAASARCRSSTIRMATASPDNYLNRAAFMRPDRRHLQHAEAVLDREPVATAERSGHDPHVQAWAPARRCSSAGRSST